VTAANPPPATWLVGDFMRVVIIGGTGHVGSYLVPRLVEAGPRRAAVTRGKRSAYQKHAAWNSVQTVMLDRATEESAGFISVKTDSRAPA